MAEDRAPQAASLAAAVDKGVKADYLRKMVRTVVYAKQHGMLDHPEARNILHQAFRECGVELLQRGTGPGGRG